VDAISGIYAICNHATGEIYIGQSRRIAQRWAEHRIALLSTRHGNAALGLVVLERTTEAVPENLYRAWDLERPRQDRGAFWCARARVAGVALYNDQLGRRRTV